MHTSQVSYFTFGTQITSPFVSLYTVTSASLSMAFPVSIERTSRPKHANYVLVYIYKPQHNIQPNVEHAMPLTAREELLFAFCMFCRAIHGLSVNIHIARGRVVKIKNMRQHIASVAPRGGPEKWPHSWKASLNRDTKCICEQQRVASTHTDPSSVRFCHC